jgi:hypothetical protein
MKKSIPSSEKVKQSGSTLNHFASLDAIRLSCLQAFRNMLTSSRYRCG